MIDFNFLLFEILNNKKLIELREEEEERAVFEIGSCLGGRERLFLTFYNSFRTSRLERDELKVFYGASWLFYGNSKSSSLF